MTGGDTSLNFAEAVAKYVGARQGVAFNSATSALHAACNALGIERGSLVWTVSISFVATANCAKMCGASVDFVDIDQKNFCISIENLRSKLRLAAETETLPDLLIVVHLGGYPVDMKEIKALTMVYNIKILEDASHALSSKRTNTTVGDCKYSDITVFSFHPVKLITSIEGGVATTSDTALAEKMRLFSSHHIERNLDQNAHAPWEYKQADLGYNYRLNDVQAAVGLSQLNKIDKLQSQRLELAQLYRNVIDPSVVTYQEYCPENISANHLFIIKINGEKKFERRLNLYKKLLEKGYKCNVHYYPIHLQPYYANFKKYYNLNNTLEYYDGCLSVPLFPGLEEKHIYSVSEIINQC